MISGIILDVDGVIVGGKSGYNWPEPHPQVTAALKNFRHSGLPVVLCTGKGTFAIENIVKAAHLDNPHIGDGGAVIADILTGSIIHQYVIPSRTVADIVSKLKEPSIYIELYGNGGYSIEKHTISDITVKHAAILGKGPSVVEVFGSMDTIKIMPVARDEGEKKMVEDIVESYKDQVSLQWGLHPTASPYHFGIITQKGISKGRAFTEVAHVVGVDMKYFLGIGDQLTDWGFMELAGYRGIMGNGSMELKAQAMQDDYIGKSVDENGILDIFGHFSVKFQP